MAQSDMMIELVIIQPITYNAAPYLITPEATPLSTLLGTSFFFCKFFD
jgi:hypothetical protein